jgi:hypothetical protein
MRRPHKRRRPVSYHEPPFFSTAQETQMNAKTLPPSVKKSKLPKRATICIAGPHIAAFYSHYDRGHGPPLPPRVSAEYADGSGGPLVEVRLLASRHKLRACPAVLREIVQKLPSLYEEYERVRAKRAHDMQAVLDSAIQGASALPHADVKTVKAAFAHFDGIPF